MVEVLWCSKRVFNWYWISMKIKWKIVEYSWFDILIFNEDGRLICIKLIDDEDCIEEN